MNPLHHEIASDIKQQAAKEGLRLDKQGDRYVGTTKPSYPLKAAVTGAIARAWIARHPELTPREYRDLLSSLSHGETHNEFAFVGVLLGARPRLRQTLEPKLLEGWLDRAEGWAEVDSICQSAFTAQELLSNWQAWKRTLVSLCKSRNVHKRRASLVLLTRPVRESDDARLAELAFANIERLKHEKDILITKAISWLLRELVKHHRADVERYLLDCADTLPKLAVRETRYKLEGGVKRKL